MEYHNLCDKCGDLLMLQHKPQPYEEIYCSSCKRIFPDGLESEWREWPDPSKPDWRGCA